MKILPEPFVQLCNIRLASPTRQCSSLAHSVKGAATALRSPLTLYTQQIPAYAMLS